MYSLKTWPSLAKKQRIEAHFQAILDFNDKKLAESFLYDTQPFVALTIANILGFHCLLSRH